MLADAASAGLAQAELQFQEQLLAWHAVHVRPFPWRVPEPYSVLVAECLLHRTRADQAARVYSSFLRLYPTPAALARADSAAVRTVLAPLGLTWRIDLLVTMARALVAIHHGCVPDSRPELLALPGVGSYIADAVLCFGFCQPMALVDTNTIRVAGRYLYGAAWQGDMRKNPRVAAAVRRLIDAERPVASNYALLDFGAMVCAARRPNCGACPVSARCVYAERTAAGQVDATRKGVSY